MEEILVKTHLIITDIHDEYHMNWCGKILDSNPELKNGCPTFIIITGQKRMEVSTINLKYLEQCAKNLTEPKGRAATTTDTARIYIKEINNGEKLLGILTHKRIKQYAPMYDKVKYL